MKKKSIGILILGVLIGVIITGCVNSNKDSNMIKSANVSASEIDSTIVEVISHQKLKSITDDSDDELFILKEKDSGKKFMLFKGYRKAGLTQIN